MTRAVARAVCCLLCCALQLVLSDPPNACAPLKTRYNATEGGGGGEKGGDGGTAVVVVIRNQRMASARYKRQADLATIVP